MDDTEHAEQNHQAERHTECHKEHRHLILFLIVYSDLTTRAGGRPGHDDPAHRDRGSGHRARWRRVLLAWAEVTLDSPPSDFIPSSTAVVAARFLCRSRVTIQPAIRLMW